MSTRVFRLVASIVIATVEADQFVASSVISASHLLKKPWALMRRESATKLIWLCALSMTCGVASTNGRAAMSIGSTSAPVRKRDVLVMRCGPVSGRWFWRSLLGI